MKRIMILFAGIILATTAVFGQNANRKGFFVELQGGAALGEVVSLSQSYSDNDNYSPYLKGGFVGSLDLGYRFRISRHFALEAKAGIWSNFAEFDQTWNIRILPGIRWTSADFGTNQSAFISLNTGFGMGDYNYMTAPVELGAGVNFTPNLYAGIVWEYNLYVGDAEPHELRTENDHYYLYPHTYNSLAIRIGYRF